MPIESAFLGRVFGCVGTAGEFGDLCRLFALEDLELAATVGLHGRLDRLDRGRAESPAALVSVDPARERHRLTRLGHDILTLDADRGRALEAEELGVLLAGNEDQLDGCLDDPLAENALQVAPRLLEMRAVLDGQQLNMKICHDLSLHRVEETVDTGEVALPVWAAQADSTEGAKR